MRSPCCRRAGTELPAGAHCTVGLSNRSGRAITSEIGFLKPPLGAKLFVATHIARVAASRQVMVARGLAARGLAARGLAARGLAARGLAARGLAARGLAARGLAARGLAARGLALGCPGLGRPGFDQPGAATRKPNSALFRTSDASRGRLTTGYPTPPSRPPGRSDPACAPARCARRHVPAPGRTAAL